MTRLFIILLVALVLGAALALFLADDPGYVQVVFHGWSLESTLGAVLLLLIVLLVLVIGGIWLLRLFNPLKLFSPKLWQRLSARRNAVQASNEGLRLLLLGHWQNAYKLLVENAERVENPMVNYLAAALAAHERGDRLGRNFCLERAEKRTEGDNYGIRSLRAWCEARDGELENAMAQLLALKRLVPDSPFILRQIKDCCLRLGDWEGLDEVLPLLEKHQVVPAAELAELRNSVARHHLLRAGTEGIEPLRLAWQDMSKAQKQDQDLATLYLQQLVKNEADVDAQALLSRQLKQHWDNALVASLGYLPSENPQQLLLILEEQLKSRPNNPVLLLTLGRVCLRNQLWEKAREYFEHALRMSDSGQLTAEISGELARLALHQGEGALALEHYQCAMQLLPHALPDLPLPARGR
ncbi:MAG TPA: heme biosynthesis HemY N-terminal domain-containing protein [Hyphomicrobiales bacterium]|nr:heme biosynthesis HemY N-terminal domain-containing protein [Hyphomicrobiales bacterium]